MRISSPLTIFFTKITKNDNPPLAQVVALLWALGLPKVEKSLYFHNKTEAIEGVSKPEGGSLEKGSNPSSEPDPKVTSNASTQALELLWAHFRAAYTNSLVIQWSLWYAISLAGFLQISTYMQVLWKSFEHEPTVGSI